MALIEKLLSGLQYLLPHHLLSGMAHALMRIKLGFVKASQIFVFSELAGVDWSESRRQKMSEFRDFNDFFTRELNDDARPLDPDPEALLSPADGKVSQCGRITGERLLQAKGRHFTLRALLANEPWARDFQDGFFHTIYLSPRNYHRVHMPMEGTLQRQVHVPGRLFSVAPYTARQIPDLFARNERVISLFDTSHGPMALVLVGAMLVSSIETVWAGQITPPRGRRVTRGDWSRRGIRLDRGAELGRFNFGSTVILLLPPGSVAKLLTYDPGDPVLQGQKLGRLR
jgi:phosphatidylserine decarboxylase